MKKLIIGLVVVSTMMTGCVSPLLSEDPEVRKQAVEKVSDQKELFFIAMNLGVGYEDRWPYYTATHIRKGEYAEDVRVLAAQRLSDPHYLLMCASWQDGDEYVDPAEESRRFEYAGETIYLNGSGGMTQAVSPGNVVRSAAIARMSEPAIFKSLPKAVQVKDEDENDYTAGKTLFPKKGKDFVDMYGDVVPDNPLNKALAQAAQKQNTKDIVSFLTEGAGWIPAVAPFAYDGCLGRISGIGDAEATKLYRELFLKDESGCVAKQYYSARRSSKEYEDVVNKAKEWVWLVYKNIDNPNLEIVKSAMKDVDQKRMSDILGRVKDPEVFVAIYGDESIVKTVPKDKKVGLSGPYGQETIDLVHDEAVEKLKLVSDTKALEALANGARLFSIRVAAIEKIEDESVLAKIASGNIKDCPFDTSLKGYSWGENGISWISKVQDDSKENLQKCAIERIRDAEKLKTVRKTVPNPEVKKAVTKRLAALGVSDVDEICAYDHYDADLFAMLETMGNATDLNKVASNARLKGVRVMAAQKISPEMFVTVAKKESVTAAQCEKGKINLGGYFLGLGIEDAYAMLAASYPSLNPKLYLDGKVLCIADAKGKDIAWANAQVKSIHWLTLPPQVVKSIVGFESGSFDDLERAVEKKLAVSFGTDIVKKGEVTQQIGNLDTTDGETLRYFKSELGKGEDFNRSVRKAINEHTIESDPMHGGVGAAFANAFEDAMQGEENAKNAKAPCFAARGSLQLQATSRATKGEWGATGKIGAAAVSIIKTLEDSVDGND